MEHADLRAFAASLVRCLRGWDPLAADAHAQHRNPQKQAFVDALTELSALAADALDMEVRRLVVDSADDDGVHLAHLVAALGQRDVLLKCKVANAVGSLCTSRVAGQRLLELHGPALVASLARMATSKNTWAQADTFFVFGWIVVVGEDALVDAELVRFVPTAIKLLARNLQKQTASQELEEQDANLRIYCLVFLLNFSQRDVGALEPQLVQLLEMLQVLIARLLETMAELLNGVDGEDPNERERLGEHIEFVRLTVTLLNALVDQVDAAPATIIALKMLPQLLKLEQALHSDPLETKLRELAGGISPSEGQGDEDAEEDQDAGEDELVAQLDDLRERMRLIKEVVLAHR